MLGIALYVLTTLAPTLAQPVEAAPPTALDLSEVMELTDLATLGMTAPAPPLTDVSSLAIAAAFTQVPAPPSAPSCADLLAQIAALEAEIAQIEIDIILNIALIDLLEDLWHENSCGTSIPGSGMTEECKQIANLHDAAMLLGHQLNVQKQGKEGALQQLLGLYAVFC